MIKSQTFYVQLGVRIKETREESGFTQEALGEEVGLSRTSITNVEKGRQKLLLHTFVNIANVLKVNPESLLPKTQLSSDGELERILKEHSTEEKQWIKAVIDAATQE
jgi:transcriptional regulator with XRE-family HTH domain